MPTAKEWHLLPHDERAIGRLAESLRVTPITAQLLLNRGLSDPAMARRFIDSSLTALHPPDLLPGVPEAARRLAAAIREKKKVCIYGDYDADGVTGTAILWKLFSMLGVPAEYHVPHRLDDGYGLRSEALRQFAHEGTQVIVTVDCGITGVAEAEEARRLGLELIITDHHEMKAELPAADVLVHPRLPGGQYPFAGLSGAGVAFKLAWEVCKQVSGSDKVEARLREFLLDAVALATLGLIADVVPLHDENRIFVKHGLARIQASPTVGIKALLESASLTVGRPLRAEDVAFKLAPRLNAVGRLGCARLVVDLLTTANEARARELAAFLDGQNKTRQQIERKISAHAREMLEGSPMNELPVIVLAHEDWHPGVIGIVAGRLADQFGKPTLLIATRGELTGGSGRSIPGFALHEALAACDDVLLSHGGHAAAAGFRVAIERIDEFRDRFAEYAAAHFPRGTPAPRLTLDAELPLNTLTFGLLRDIDRLEPFGAENRRPRFLAGGLQVQGEPKRIGGGERHLSFRVAQGAAGVRCVAFGMGDRIEELMSEGGRCCLAFTPQINEWNDIRRIELEVVDFQAGATARLV